MYVQSPNIHPLVVTALTIRICIINGNLLVQISGREMFQFDPSLVDTEDGGDEEGDGALDLGALDRTPEDGEEDEEEQVQVREGPICKSVVA